MGDLTGKKVLLANQFGDGRGHVTMLRIVGEALAAHGVTCSAALAKLEHAHELRHIASSVRASPRLPNFANVRRGDNRELAAATYGEFLGDLGFASTQIVEKHVAYWRALIKSERPDVVVGDQSPCALLAARSLKIPTAALGNTYGLPPTSLEEFPNLLDEFQHRVWSETEMRDTINKVVVPLGVSPLSRLSEIYLADVTLPMGIRLLDPYADARTEPRISPPVAHTRTADWRKRKEIFLYLSGRDRADPAMLRFVRTVRLPVRAYISGSNEATRALFREAGTTVEEKPVSPRVIARRSRVMFHAGSFGIMCLGIRAGIPQVSAPQHLEQMFHARRLEQAGAGRTVGWFERNAKTYVRIVHEHYEDRTAHEAAEELSRRTADDFERIGRNRRRAIAAVDPGAELPKSAHAGQWIRRRRLRLRLMHR